MFTSNGCGSVQPSPASVTSVAEASFDEHQHHHPAHQEAPEPPQDLLACQQSHGDALAAPGGGEDVMKQPLIGKQFSLCPDTGELEASRRSQSAGQQQQPAPGVEEGAHTATDTGVGLGLGGDQLSGPNAFVGSDLVDAKLLASLSFENLDLKLEDPSTNELLEHVVKSEGGGGEQYVDAVALAALGTSVGGASVDLVGSPVSSVKREPVTAAGGHVVCAGGLDDDLIGQPAKVRRVMVGDAAIQQLLSAAGQVVTSSGDAGGSRAVSLAVDPRLLAATQQQLSLQQQQQQSAAVTGGQQQQIVQQQSPIPQQQQQQATQAQQTRFLIAWKAENNELVPVCIPVQTGAAGAAGVQKAVQLADGGEVLSQLPQAVSAQHPVATSGAPGAPQGTIIQLPSSGIIPALAQGATIQIPAGSAFPGLTQALQIPSSGILHAAGPQGTVLQLPTTPLAHGAGELASSGLPQGATILQIPAGQLSQQLANCQAQQQAPAGQQQQQPVGADSLVIKEDHDIDVGEEEVVPDKGLADDVTSSVTDGGASGAPGNGASSAAPAQVPAPDQDEVEMEADEEQDAESWRLRHAVTILEKSQINFLRDARRSFKCYQCGGLIRPPALEVEVDLAPYGIRPVLCTDCGKFHLNKRNVNVRVTTDEGCEQLHRFMSA